MLRTGILDQLTAFSAVGMFVCSVILDLPLLYLIAGVLIQFHCVIFTFMLYFCAVGDFPADDGDQADKSIRQSESINKESDADSCCRRYSGRICIAYSHDILASPNGDLHH